jgi:HSP20 family protein
MVSDWRPFDSLRREVDRIFEDFGRGFGWSPFRGSPFGMQPFGGTEAAWRAPAVDVAETDSAYEIKAELPGMEQSDLEVNVSDDVLTIRGEK